MAFLKSPKDVPQFFACFPNWPADSLEHRANIEAGSKWGLREIGSFKLLRRSHGPRFPAQLEDDAAEALRRVGGSQDIKTAVKFLDSNWQQHNRSELLRLGGTFAPFFSLLAEVLEQPATPKPDRYFRTADNTSDATFPE